MWSDTLLPQHRELLVASAITPAIARTRGYVSVEDKGRLANLGYNKTQQRVPGLLIPSYTVRGEQQGVVYRPDSPRKVSGKNCKYEYIAGAVMRLDVHPAALCAVKDRDEILVVTEGIRKGDSALTAGLPCIALGGVWNWRNKYGPLLDWKEVPLKGREIWVAFDSDVMVNGNVHDALEALAEFLTGEGARVLFCYLSTSEDGEKVGLDDYFASGHGVEDLKHLIERELRPLTDQRGRTRTVFVTDPPLDQKDAALAALVQHNSPPSVFSVGGQLVRVASDDDGARIELLTKPMLRDQLEHSATWLSPTRMGAREVAPPSAIIEDLLVYPDHHSRFPVLKQIVSAPCFAADGTLIDTVGYSEAAQLYLDLRGLVVPRLPRVDEAVQLLVGELLVDFPFATEADLANALALYLLPYARPLIDGTTPLHMVEAPTPGTGKGLLADMLLYPVSGGKVARSSECGDDDEWRKRLTALLVSGRQVVLIDNVNRPLDSGVLANALTSEVWEDRILGHTQLVTVHNRSIWVATGNNPVLSAELARRSVYIRLDANVEQPWTREGFRYKDLRGWAAEHRGELVAAGLSIVSAWLDAGRPLADIAFGDFRGWATVVGGILQVAGVGGFLANASDRFEAVAGELDELRAFVSVWWDLHREKAVKSSELLPLADVWAVGPQLADKRDRATSFGMWLKKQVDRVVDGKRVTLDKTDRNGAKFYKLVSVHAGDGQGFRTKTPGQSASAEPCGTLANPQAFSNTLDAELTYIEVSAGGTAGFRTPPSTSTVGAEPLQRDTRSVASHGTQTPLKKVRL